MGVEPELVTTEPAPQFIEIESRAPTPARRAMSRRQVAVLAVLAGSQLIGVLDFAIVTLALPSIARDFHLKADSLQWVVSAFVLAQAAFLLLGGRLCDVYNRKRVFIAAVLAFGVASLGGGLAPSAVWVDVARAVQGLAGAVLAPASLALVTQEFAGDLRNRALGVFGSVAAGGFILGVIAGGVLTGYVGWRSVFFINVPLVVVIAVLSARVITSKPALDSDARLDLRGAALGAVVVLSLAVGLTQLPSQPNRAVFLFLVSAIALSAFVLVERSARSPLVPLQVFRSLRFSGANGIAGLTYTAFFASTFTITLVAQQVMGLRPQVAGLLFVPAGFASIASGTFTATAVRRFGLRVTNVAALACITAGMAAILIFGLSGSPIWLAVGNTLSGVGQIPALVTCTIAVTSSVDARRVGVAGGVLNTIQFVCGAVGTAAAGVLDNPGTRSAFGASLVFAIAVVMIAIALSIASQRRG